MLKCVIFLICFCTELLAFNLNPAFEGVYNIRMECRDNPATLDCKKLNDDFNLVMFNTSDAKYGQYGSIISIIDKKLPIQIYFFYVDDLKEVGSNLSTTGTSKGYRPAEILFDVKRDGELFGWLRDFRFKSDIKISGKIVQSTEIFYHSNVEPMSTSSLYGSFRGHAGGTQGILNIRPSLMGNGAITAVFSSDIGVNFYFNIVEFIPEKGVLNLIDSEAPFKWTLSLQEASEKIGFIGIGMSALNGRYYSISLDKESD